MAQAATSNTDELLSQLAASEIDRLLSESDAVPKEDANPVESAPAGGSPTTAEGSERAALLQAAGFDSPDAAQSATADAPPLEDERSALLHAAGFESPEEMGMQPKPPPQVVVENPEEPDSGETPLYLKPLVWINAPLNSSPALVRQILGKVGLVTLVNALAVLTYVIFFRKH